MRIMLRKVYLGLMSTLALVCVGLISDPAIADNQIWKSRPASKKTPVVRVYDFSPLVKEIKPTVFNLFVEGTRASGRRSYGWPFSRRYRFRSRGSGFFISAKGYALTNYHVVRNATKIRAQTYDKQVYKVKVLGKSPELDVALIRVIHPQGEKFRFAYLGNSDQAEVGGPVVAIGNARGLGLTVTAGIISAKGRELGGQYQAFIQTDAAINRGNSGGPLFNQNGEVVGINTAILRGGRGIGFAVPINIVKRILPQLQKRGFVQRAQLGVMIQAVDPTLARSFRLPRPMGALVAEVNPRSPAAVGGIRVGDVIIAFNGSPINKFTDLPRMVAFSPAGAKVRLTVVRQGRRLTRLVRLVKWGATVIARRNQGVQGPGDQGPGDRGQGDQEGDNFLSGRRARPNKPNTNKPSQRPSASTSRALRRLGIGVGSVSAATRQRMRLGATGGVLVTSVRNGSPAARNGLTRGDVIIEINRTPVRSIRGFLKQLSSVPKGENVLLLVRRDDSALFLAFPLP